MKRYENDFLSIETVQERRIVVNDSNGNFITYVGGSDEMTTEEVDEHISGMVNSLDGLSDEETCLTLIDMFPLTLADYIEKTDNLVEEYYNIIGDYAVMQCLY